jgi:hypothetical protein
MTLIWWLQLNKSPGAAHKTHGFTLGSQPQGLAVFGVVARPRGRLFKEHIIRFTLPAKKGGSKHNNKGKGTSPLPFGPRAPLLHYHRLGTGDIISITPDKANPLNCADVMEGLVLERGPYFIDVVVKEIPPGIVWQKNNPTGG